VEINELIPKFISKCKAWKLKQEDSKLKASLDCRVTQGQEWSSNLKDIQSRRIDAAGYQGS
jgi:hypothetical protein